MTKPAPDVPVGRGVRSAFTLIELLVVIAIIAILAAILFPVFAQAKESAKQTQCIMQMKQIGTALAMYADEHDGFWAAAANAASAGANFAPQNPWIGYDNRNQGRVGSWWGNIQRPAKYPARPGMIDPYIKNEAVKRCPKSPAGAQMVVAANLWSPSSTSSYYNVNPKARGNEFGPAAKSCRTTSGFTVCEGANEGEIEDTASTMAVWEHGSPVPGCNFLQQPNWFNSPPRGNNYISHFQLLHREGSIIIWTDTHVRRLSYFQLKRPMFSSRKDIYQ